VIEGIRKMGRIALVDGLSQRLYEVEWGTDDLASVVNAYVMELCRKAGGAILIRLSPIIDLGLDVADGATSAAQLAALQSFDPRDFDVVVAEAWKKANNVDPPEGVGYRHFGGEVALATIRRLRPRR